MRYVKISIILLGLLLVLTSGVFAQVNEDLKPGITPDSPFYFLDTMFDGFQSSENVANEKAAEMIVMAQENKIDALEKAKQRYEKAMQKRNRQSEETEEDAEEVARQASYHLEVLAEVYEKVPEQAKNGIENAMENSARSLNNSLNNLTEMNPERGARVAQEVLTEILENAPEQAKPGLQSALDSVGVSGVAQLGEAEGIPANKSQGDNFRLMVSDAPADIGDFEYLTVELIKTRIFRVNGSENGFEERDLNVSVDLTKLVDENSLEVLSTELEPGKYTKIELYVGSVNAKANNETADVMVPSEKLKIVKTFEISEGNVTTFVFDINVVKKGLENNYNLLPVISESGVVGEDLEEEEVEEIEVECTSNEDCEEGYTCENNECEEIEVEVEEESEDNETSQNETE